MRHVVVGCGSIGQRHLKNLRSLGEKDLWTVDPAAVKREWAKREVGARALGELETAGLAEGDVVYVTLHSAGHMQVALAAAKSGCHIFVEKPLATTLEGVDELIAEMNRQSRAGFVGSNWKFHPSFLMMKGLLDSAAIGRVLTARCIAGQYLPDWHPWEDYRNMYSAKKAQGGGVLFDSHEFDYLGWFLGKVKDLCCFSGKLSDLEIETEDAALALLRFESGALAQVQVDYLQRAYQRRYEFCGTEGSLVWDVNDRAVRLYRAAENNWETFPLAADYQSNQMYVDELKHFLDCVSGRAMPVTPLERGREVLEILLASHRSAVSGEIVRF